MAESGKPTGEEKKIRVLIVDDIPETRENLRKLLFFESDIEVVGAATSGEEGISMAGDLKPDIVLMDINMLDAGWRS
jgi:pilus assembly protein CpaE